MIKHIICTAAFLLGSSALHAGTFDFSFSGTGVSASGLLTTDSNDDITSITGTQNGKTISDGSGNLTLFGSYVLGGSLIFDLPGSTQESVTDFWGSASETTGDRSVSLSSISINAVSGVPESATFLLLLTMGLGVWVMVRQLPSRNNL